MSFCTSCGAEISEGAVFCTNCGTKLSSENYSNDITTDSSFVSNINTDQIDFDDLNLGYTAKLRKKSKNNSKTAVWVIAGAAVLVILMISLLIFLLSNGHHSFLQSDLPSDSITRNSNLVAGSGFVGSGNLEISVIGADSTWDLDENPTLRVYFMFTNHGKYPVSADSSLNYEGTQDGSPLKRTYLWESNEPYEPYYNSQLLIRPGASALCSSELTYDPGGGSVDIIFFDAYEGADGGTVKVSYSPHFLPGKPSSINNDPLPAKWTVNLPSSGTLDSVYFASVTGAELTQDTRGLPSVRVFYEFSNNGTEPTSLSEALYTLSYQDGAQLIPTESIPKLSEDKAFYREIQPGESIKASCVYLLRNSSSPVEAEVEASLSYESVGETFEIK